jgi:hypothetical protein
LKQILATLIPKKSWKMPAPILLRENGVLTETLDNKYLKGDYPNAYWIID